MGNMTRYLALVSMYSEVNRFNNDKPRTGLRLVARVHLVERYLVAQRRELLQGNIDWQSLAVTGVLVRSA